MTSCGCGFVSASSATRLNLPYVYILRCENHEQVTASRSLMDRTYWSRVQLPGTAPLPFKRSTDSNSQDCVFA